MAFACITSQSNEPREGPTGDDGGLVDPSADGGTVDRPGDGGPDGRPGDSGIVLQGRQPWPMGTTYILSGHSLTDTVISNPWPGRLVRAVQLDSGGSFSNVAKSTLPGSPISWRWNNPEAPGDQTAQWPEDIGDFQGLVTTTRVPLFANDGVRQAEQVDWLKRAVDDAWRNGNDGRGAATLLYTTWTHLTADPGSPHPEDNLPFRTRLDRDQARWEAMQDFVNRSVPSGQVPLYMIPGHRLMMRVHDDIEAGNSPFRNIRDIFADGIHPNDIGAYGVTLLYYACIYGRDPGAFLPDRLDPTDTISPVQAQYFKRIVPEVVTRYSSRTGLSSLSRN